MAVLAAVADSVSTCLAAARDGLVGVVTAVVVTAVVVTAAIDVVAVIVVIPIVRDDFTAFVVVVFGGVQAAQLNGLT